MILSAFAIWPGSGATGGGISTETRFRLLGRVPAGVSPDVAAVVGSVVPVLGSRSVVMIHFPFLGFGFSDHLARFLGRRARCPLDIS